ncbi:hypothetical protein HF329_23480 [Chitinophaga oryzae]|uniref:Uncharacterized protein n=1 Tax=Chitinophaga oryzae TaxID=2725414 RepID=A0AAE6ZIY1_9BACT|nr:hypothetical protein [Chitinophaga oryzae]QJB34086.1 hypothetical protein HF329_23480 [Chitinophaga oryzae]
MRKKRKRQPNMLRQIHQEINSFISVYRQAICQECDWSTPTYYRKLRENENPELSIMETKTAISVGLSITQNIQTKLKAIEKAYNKPDH